MAARRKLIVVSNRAPVTFGRGADGQRTAKRGAGGLVTALRSLVEHHDVTWIASAMGDEDRAAAAEAGGEAIDETLGEAPYRLRLVAHDPEAYHLYYNVVANPLLWFTQHYLWGLAAAPTFDGGLARAWEEGYAAVNAAFADAVCAELEREPEAAVFFHDYQLYLAPGIVRERAPRTALAHFVHIPWPHPDSWRVLPEPLRVAIHRGLLANDIVGFHTTRWQRNFLRSAEDVLGAEVDAAAGEARLGGHVARVRARPISVDPEEFDALAESERVLAAERALESERREHLVVRVDRTDPSKNVVRGLQAYGLLLERHPELHGSVSMLALLAPSRQDIPEYAEYLAEIERVASDVNTRFAGDGWTPLDLRVQDDFPASVAAYKQFDVLLVNAIFDGMNLVAKEAPLVNRRDGVLVLSENAGVHEELGEWALTVSPFDLVGQAEAIHAGLTMEAGERRRRLDAIRAHVREHDVERWIEAQLRDLEGAREHLRTTLGAT